MRPTIFRTYCPICKDICSFKRREHDQAFCQQCGCNFSYIILRRNHDEQMFRDRREESGL